MKHELDDINAVMLARKDDETGEKEGCSAYNDFNEKLIELASMYFAEANMREYEKEIFMIS